MILNLIHSGVKALGLNGGADFYGRNPKELRCGVIEKSLTRMSSLKYREEKRYASLAATTQVKFNLTNLTCTLHEHASQVVLRTPEGRSINKLAQEALQRFKFQMLADVLCYVRAFGEPDATSGCTADVKGLYNVSFSSFD